MLEPVHLLCIRLALSLRNGYDNEIKWDTEIVAAVPPLRALIRLEMATVSPIAIPENTTFIRPLNRPHIPLDRHRNGAIPDVNGDRFVFIVLAVMVRTPWGINV
jgi:hypothetical protein